MGPIRQTFGQIIGFVVVLGRPSQSKAGQGNRSTSDGYALCNPIHFVGLRNKPAPIFAAADPATGCK